MIHSNRQSFSRNIRILTVALCGVALCGCGVSQMTSSIGDGGLFSSDKKPDAPSWKPAITEDSMMTAARTNSDGPVEQASAAACHHFKSKGGNAISLITKITVSVTVSSVIHKGEITKTARECQANDSQVAVKYGVAGRVLLGPKGKPGTVTLPVTMQIVDRTKAKVKSESFMVTVTITKQNPLAYFSIVRDISIPIKTGTTPQDYSIVLAFEKSKGAV